MHDQRLNDLSGDGSIISTEVDLWLCRGYLLVTEFEFLLDVASWNV